ncbi:MAG: hypothetical protein OES38_17235 [Gammaproteobacteria bacterium]|nr:hypothetical protein [Gammaproteobacteria bacterium]
MSTSRADRAGWLKRSPSGGVLMAALLAVTAVVGCSSSPPSRPDDICAVFREKSGWYKDARRAQKRWGLPVSVGMAFVHKESAYVADAKPPRGKLLWVIPWRRPSSAYGYAQATDAAWGEYLEETRGMFRERDDLGNALDFIGWYNDRSHRRLGIARNDAYNLYLAYYVGPGGYARGHYRKQPAVQSYARRVSERSQRYAGQLSRCEKKLNRGWWPL